MRAQARTWPAPKRLSRTGRCQCTRRRVRGGERQPEICRDTNRQALAYMYSRDHPTEALQAKMLTKDEAARRREHCQVAGAAREW